MFSRVIVTYIARRSFTGREPGRRSAFLFCFSGAVLMAFLLKVAIFATMVTVGSTRPTVMAIF